MNSQAVYATLAGLLTLGGCASSQGERVREAHIEKIDAQTEAQRQGIDERADNRSDQIEDRYDAKQERVEASGRPGEDASETLVEISAERSQYQSEARARLNVLATRINAAHEKIQVLGSRAPLPLKTELETTAQQYDLLKSDVMNLSSTPPAKWDETKQDIEQRASLLDDRVSQLNERIDDV